ncbi:MAG: methyltransferase domain-containing protein, partial [Mesorhizobium sp.]|nr:methyltransferase domain-containing protein [Mesorhizobium sp.]
MKTETPCQLCGAHDFEVVSERDRHGGALRTVLCLGCGSVTNDPIPSDAELEAFYRSDYRTSYKGTPEPRARQIWRNFDRIERHVRANRQFYDGRSRCLDLGSGSGEFMYMAGGMGIDCIGVEPNEPYAAYARGRLGLNVLTQTLEATEFPAGQFDLIRLSHVMEHMREPVRS